MHALRVYGGLAHYGIIIPYVEDTVNRDADILLSSSAVTKVSRIG